MLRKTASIIAIICITVLMAVTLTSCFKCDHDYEAIVRDPDCFNEGYTEHRCTKCEESYTDAPTPKTTHRFNGGACLNCGMAEIVESFTPNTDWYSELSGVFTIGTAEELAGLASLVGEGTDFAGTTVKLSANIDLGYKEWTPIGNGEHPFAGSFDGSNFTVSGLKVNAEGPYIGLFGNVSGSITNLKIKDASIWSEGNFNYAGIAAGYSTSLPTNISVSGYLDAPNSDYVGSVVGYATVNTSTFNSLSSTARVSGNNYTGGIIGYIKAASAIQSSNISFEGYIKGGDYTGGAAGYLASSGIIYTDAQTVKGEIEGAGNTGGIYGYVKGTADSLIRNCTVSASITGAHSVGAIVGRAENVGVASCDNSGSSLSATSALIDGGSFYAYLGGYVGYGYTVDGCNNAADITYTLKGTGVGGVAGCVTKSITNCENSGAIVGFGEVGGVVGRLLTPAGASILNLTNKGKITGAGDKTGGVIGGHVPSGSMAFSSLTNLSDVKGVGFTGGVVGASNHTRNSSYTITAQALTNTANVKGDGSNVGGLFGYIGGATASLVKDSVSSGEITGLYKVGGLVGEASGVSVQKCSNVGSKISATGWYADGTATYVWLGGYVGCGYSVSECNNETNISYSGLGSYVGGIIGYTDGIVRDCTNLGNITSAGSDVGGVIGKSERESLDMQMTNLKNAGNVSGVNYVGGIVGYFRQYCDAGNSSCSSVGLENTGNVSGNSYVGGVIGYATVWNYGAYGYTYYRLAVNISKITSTGDVSATSNAGLLIGYFECDTSDSTIKQYTAEGTVTQNGAVVENQIIGGGTSIEISEPNEEAAAE